MSGENRKWEFLTDVDFIGSSVPGTALVGFLEFTDDVWLVCSHQEESCGSELSPSSHTDKQDSGLSDWDDIPF